MLAGEQKELIKDILFTLTRMAAMMQRENYLFLIKVVIHIYSWLDCVPMELKNYIYVFWIYSPWFLLI